MEIDEMFYFFQIILNYIHLKSSPHSMQLFCWPHVHLGFQDLCSKFFDQRRKHTVKQRR